MTNTIAVREGQAPVLEGQDRYRIPAADVYETGDAFVLLLDLPGVEKDGITLTHEKGELRLRAVTRMQEQPGVKMLVREVRPATFARTFTIGEGIDINTIDARFEAGVLTVKMYKSPAARAREIAIN